MAYLFDSGFEAGNFDEPFSSGSSSSFIQSTIKRGGVYAYKVAATTSASESCVFGTFSATTGAQAEYSVGTVYHTFDFYYVIKPASLWEKILEGLSTGSGQKGSVGINSSGQLVAINSSNTLVATGTTVLAANTWYCIEFQGANGTSGAYEIRINGVTELSGTMNQAATNHALCRVGKQNVNNNTVEFYYDNVAGSDSAFRGPAKNVAMTLNKNGSTQQWTSGTGTGFAEVDEIPANGTDYVKNSTSANQTALFGFATSASSGITGIINSVTVLLPRIREDTSVTSSVFGVLRTHATNYDINSSGQNLTTGSSWIGKVYTTNPNTGVAWTLAEIDALEAGAREVNASAQIRLISVQVYVDFTPGGVSDLCTIGAGAGF